MKHKPFGPTPREMRERDEFWFSVLLAVAIAAALGVVVWVCGKFN